MRKFVKNKLSIIIPTFNEADNVNRLIDEIISEVENEEYEIIIVDDGSTITQLIIYLKSSIKFEDKSNSKA